MEIVFDSHASVEKYSTRIYLISSLEDLAHCPLSPFERDMFAKKQATFTQTSYIWVESIDAVSYVVMLAANNTCETLDLVRQLGKDVYTAIRSTKADTCALCNVSAAEDAAYAFTEGFALSTYSFAKYASRIKANPIQTLVCTGTSFGNMEELTHIINGISITKNAINEPNNVCTAEWFAKYAEECLRGSGAAVAVHDKAWIEKENMQGVLAVNRGSVLPPYFVHIVWNPKNDDSQPVVLVGKGIVFDSGGLSLKPNSSMETMKSDMSGAATVLGVMRCIASEKLPMHVEALIPLTDNRPGENALALGDILQMRNGVNVEVLNTDAEGRLILADALSYASSLHPRLTIDIATLTGAANMAVGEHAAVYFSTADAKTCSTIEDTSMHVWEPLVRFPLWTYYEDLIVSKMADIKNTGGQYGGAVAAAKFLQRFVSYPWIHLDIAGSAYFKQAWSYKGVGATGFGFRLLYTFLKTLQ